MKSQYGVRHRCGFTLIELLLASLLFSIIALSAYLVFSQGVRIEKRLRHGSMMNQGTFWAVKRIERDLQNMDPLSFFESNEIDLEGGKNNISFLISSDFGLQEVHYQLRDLEYSDIHRIEVNRGTRRPDRIKIGQTAAKSPRYKLVRSSRSFLKQEGAEDVTEAYEIEILSQNVLEDGFVLSYLEVDEEGNKEWASEWSAEKWPLAIRVDLTVAGEDGSPSRIVKDVFLFNKQEGF